MDSTLHIMPKFLVFQNQSSLLKQKKVVFPNGMLEKNKSKFLIFNYIYFYKCSFKYCLKFCTKPAATDKLLPFETKIGYLAQIPNEHLVIQ